MNHYNYRDLKIPSDIIVIVSDSRVGQVDNDQYKKG